MAIRFIYPFTSCFQFPLLVNVAVNIYGLSLCVDVFLFLLGRYLEVELLGHIVALTFWETAKLFIQSGYTILHSQQ